MANISPNGPKKSLQIYLDPDLHTEVVSEVERRQAQVAKYGASDFGREAVVEKLYRVPVLGYVSAGAGMDVTPFEEGFYRYVSEERYSTGAYVLISVGESMNGGKTPIKSGEALLFLPCEEPRQNQIVHAEWQDGFTTICTVKKFSKNGFGDVTLSPANAEGFEPIVFKAETTGIESLQIRGCFQKVL